MPHNAEERLSNVGSVLAMRVTGLSALRLAAVTGALACLIGLGLAVRGAAAASAGRHRAQLTGTIRVERSRLRAGAELKAELVLHNPFHRTRVLARGCPHGFVQLMLSNRQLTQTVAWAEPACNDASFDARPGTTVYRLEVATTYLSCTMVGHKPSAGVPQCLPGNRMPPLPAGVYKVSVASNGLQLQHELAQVRPAYVRVTGA